MQVESCRCLHSNAGDLGFLLPISKKLEEGFKDRYSYHELKDTQSEDKARYLLGKDESSLAVILTHGSSSYLLGSEPRRRRNDVSEPSYFLKASNLEVLRNKVVFCLSCDSNGLASAAMDKGVTSFVGFDDVPFDRFDTSGNPIGSEALRKHTQRLIADSLILMFNKFMYSGLSLEEAVDILRLILYRQAQNFVRNNPGEGSKREIAGLLLKVEKGLTLHGEKKVYCKLPTD